MGMRKLMVGTTRIGLDDARCASCVSDQVVVTSPLLETKFHLPRRRRGLVARSRLSDRLSRGGESALTLVSAPAGFGKTTLLTEWLAAQPAEGHSAAWLSLDPRDNDPELFWTYLIAALQTVAPEVGASALSLLQGSPATIEEVLATLLNDLPVISNDVVVVLDDYHVIEAHEVHEGMVFLLEHLPPRVRLVIASRADPPLPLARLRARGELVEIRAADLRFTPDEAAAYLNDMMGLELTAPDVAALEARTEGWIAALQLAALSMQGRDDVAGFIAGFSGDDRYIVDYLVGEVLQRQPEPVRTFLLETSILGRLTGSLCNAVTGQVDGRAMLEALDRGNLFLVPLDDRRLWYRYHHLFADVLRARLMDEHPTLVSELHRRASDWYEQNGERPEAFRHAMAGGDFERAADLVELAIPAMSQARQEATMRGWLDALPEEVFAVRPVLSIGYVGVLMQSGEVGGVDARLRDAERWLDTIAAGRDGPDAPKTDMVVVDEALLDRLPAQIAVYRAALARTAGDVEGTITYAQRAFDLLGADDHLGRGGAAGLLALAQWTGGHLDAAHRSWSDAKASLEMAGHFADTLGCALALADIAIAKGRLREAMATYERGLDVATGSGAVVLRGAADMHVGMSELFRERNDLDAAMHHLETSRELGEHLGLPQNAHRSRVAMARILQTQGDLVGALVLLDEAERLYASDFFPDVRPVAALRARVWVAQGEIGAAFDWARERHLSVDDDLSYLREFEHITLARALLAQPTAEGADRSGREAATLLARLLAAAEDGQRNGTAIEILVLQALAHQAQTDMPAALASLEQALTRAEPEGYTRVFLDEGPPMTALLRAAAKRGVAPDSVGRLVAGDGQTKHRAPARGGLVDPLSSRELDVLRLLRTDLNGPDIARELMVSLNTMRTHTKTIYSKLGVNDRRAAVRRADELGL
jgi:LuxR family maltose regulon positive regulatory protein